MSRIRPDVRQDRIVSLVEEEGTVSVDSLADRLGTSRETIRRDLTRLDRRGLLRKVHGGARRLEPETARIEGPFAARMAENVEAKRAIARTAATLFSDGDTIMMDSGSTTVIFAEHLLALKRLTLVTNSVRALSLFPRGDHQNHLFLLGGEFSVDLQETLGPMAVEQLTQFHAEHAVLTVGAVQPDGIYDFDLRETELARAMVARARRLTVLADSSKFDRGAVFEVAGLEKVQRIVTDRRPDAGVAAALAAQGVELIVAAETP
ncbi:DeoR/GlpR family DNA-binding transcription regulator [Pseudodonghicola flavimaris]|uniref:DeoR/GlpR family DNA-binding transcription regulator n=1 Tax=Pseudodonghicola flavimaris TaxID=3050036 RepID=A0ABT7F2G1_9RHOB|nr:DeoR/GlpR family DNA-binding transcription regulator [Pseudodonghicola flavimaris]MDK3018777.1 DeoR/GlpR family DNA-binding transcription regulator [Pseudodonghicola flavimaris]